MIEFPGSEILCTFLNALSELGETTWMDATKGIPLRTMDYAEQQKLCKWNKERNRISLTAKGRKVLADLIENCKALAILENMKKQGQEHPT